ncbi:hypothetical protein JTE90_022597 [Oedothorax gibbosus]|uniref:Uncharacterized protein n=1 Tax=Oedothorax gibbosus TaxID=931172 RepID=A0AAV6TFD8_9ARAC|nr:hypothetical protein JTE90_022597 [Oedothorax gibbosus]
MASRQNTRTKCRTCGSSRTEQDYFATTSIMTRGCSPGDLLRIWVRTGTKITLSPSDFQGPNRGAPRHRKRRGALREQRPISGRADSRDKNSYKEKITLPGSSVDVSEFGAITALVPKDPILVSGWGNINPIPVRSAARQTQHVLRFGRRLAFGTDFLRSLGRMTHVQCFTHGTLLQASVLKLSLSICYYHQDLHRCGPGGARPAPQRTPPRPSYQRRKPHEGSSAVAARYRPKRGGHPFPGSMLRSVSCYTLLANSDFHGLVRLLEQQHLSWGLMSVSHRRLNRGGVWFIPQRQFCYQKWPPMGNLILSRPALVIARRDFSPI